MQQVCNKFVMDMTDTRMGPEQKCRNCQFMKKEHSQSNSQQLPQTESGQNKISDIMKKFSGPNNQVQDKFQGAVKTSVQLKKQEEKIPPQSTANQTESQSQQQNFPIRKIDSQTLSNDTPVQNKNQPSLNKQPSNTSNQQSNAGNQQPQKQQAQIETAPVQTKLSNNPFLQNDKSQKKEVTFVKPAPKTGEESKQSQQTVQDKIGQQTEEKNNVVSEDQNQKSNFQEIKNAFAKQSPLIQNDSTAGSQQSPTKLQNGGNKLQGNQTNIPIFRFGPPPVNRPSIQQDPESCIEQQLLDRPTIQQKNKRTVQEFTDFN
ncbi:unnamed protein product (macronuclear) [Paramecium tetraurelia]|uniref:Uncharacterized protein n=1 Tax=Paramecium tetraurelia TaxID=5888 RepID=A0E6B5_PARTE|nr:uncharacterized protein GSPATT00003697001 [Paramecium tetraurelia]CAK90832.1 unnamed protein product [Paramecium tetraurelia]|eukprot:XP_001458229.1 hypothetical protein (macronuclear) [Paramecium tetraurelia strain d4-2]